MTVQTASKRMEGQKNAAVTPGQWVKIGAAAALTAVVIVLVAQAAALSLWPEAAAFRPLNSYPRAVLFTVVPALIATALYAKLARSGSPTGKFIKIAAFILLASFIPDYILPDAHRTFLASTIAAGLHVAAAAAITGVLVAGYQWTVTGN